MDKKTCVRCKQEKSITEFGPHKRAKDGRTYHCYDCNRKADKAYRKSGRAKSVSRQWRYDNPAKTLLYAARRRAKRDGVPCTITEEDIVIPEFCPVLGIKLAGGRGKIGPLPSAPTIDKIDPKLGYTPMNIQVISHKANIMKNNASVQELVSFAHWVLERMSGWGIE